MSLAINISDIQAAYRPGDQISGTVTFTPNNKSVTAQQVYISLKHISKCRFGLPELETLYSSELLLHERTIDLLEGPITLSHNQQWSFKFIVPSSTGFLNTPFHEPSRLYNNDSEQVLPPSFDILKKETATIQDGVKITLGLYAHVESEKIRSNVFKKDAIHAVSLLNFVPPRKIVQVDWGMTTKRSNFEARTPLLAETNGHRDRHLSIKEKMLTTLKSNSLPSASFDVLLSLPKTAVIGQPIPLFIGLQHDKTKNQAQDNPPVTMKSLVVQLETITSLRGLSESKSVFRAEYLPASHSSFTRAAEIAKLSGPIELKDIIDLREHLVIRIPPDTVQSFSTFNIARTYNLQILINIECAKQKLSTTFDLYPLRLLAPHDNDIITPPGIGLTTSGIDEEKLPTWEESGGYGFHGIPIEKEEDILPPQYA